MSESFGPPIRIASGQTPSGTTAWQVYGSANGIFVDVDTRAGNFAAVPVYVTSIGGDNHWSTTGATGIYNAAPTGFRVYVRWADGSPLTPEYANASRWHINWIGMEI